MKHALHLLLAALTVTCGVTSCAEDDARPDFGPCVPSSCADRSHVCGTIEDGCGGLVSCGTCPDDHVCNHGQCIKPCVPSCGDQCSGESNCPGIMCADDCHLTGRTCVVSDGVGTCTGDCIPRTCKSIGYDCQTVNDWCGDTIDCGECLPGSECTFGKCSPGDAVGLGVNCEYDKDACQEVFPTCMKLPGSPAFCTRECTSDGQCGKDNCCAAVKDGKHLCVPAGSEYICKTPVGNQDCAIGETCLPSPVGGCLFCFDEGILKSGQECQSFNECVAGFACVRLPGADKAACQEICDPALIDSCIDGKTVRHCVEQDSMSGYGVCVDGAARCSPDKVGADCPTGFNCIPEDASCTAFRCAAAGSKPIGDTCSRHADCIKGGYCADGRCRSLCAAAAPCGEFMGCVQGCSTRIRFCEPVGGQACSPGGPADQCPEQMTCLPKSMTACIEGECVKHGNTTAGGKCVTHRDCAAGTLCLDGICLATCSLTKACTLPSSCIWPCSGLDLGVCIGG